MWARVHREFFLRHPDQFDFTIPGKEYIEALAAFVAEKCTMLGSAGTSKEICEGQQA
jgi:fructose-bisphosphate aldolase class II